MITLQSPAKINIFLRVVGKHPDGRPETAALCQAVDLCDEMHFTFSEKDSFQCSEESLPLKYVERIQEAVEIFRNKTGKRSPIEISLDKKIPTHSGLSGRSSNAATTLWALNKLHGEIADTKDLQLWSKEIAYDTSFFFSEGTQLHQGQEVTEMTFQAIASSPVWIALPSQKMPLDALFNRLRLEELHTRELDKLISHANDGKFSYFNDLEEPAIAIFPKLALIKERLLEAGATKVVMNGSGPSLVCYDLINPPQLQNVTFYRANTISRPRGEWY